VKKNKFLNKVKAIKGNKLNQVNKEAVTLQKEEEEEKLLRHHLNKRNMRNKRNNHQKNKKTLFTLILLTHLVQEAHIEILLLINTI